MAKLQMKFSPGEYASIVNVRDPAKANLVGKEIYINTQAPSEDLPYLFVRVTGWVGKEKVSFPEGVRLRRKESRPCRCSAYPFPHRRGRLCREVESNATSS